MRTFETGATRDNDDTKPDYEGFMSPLVVEEFGRYMTRHRKQADGQLRDSDNWQKGIPLTAYMKSMWRHFHAVWKSHRSGASGGTVAHNTLEQQLEELMALKFNVDGYAHELLKLRESLLGGADLDAQKVRQDEHPRVIVRR